jgi:membrane protease YdiL (CAAX protease family)
VEKTSTSPRSPLSPALWPPEAFGIAPSVAVALGFLAMLFAGDGLALALTHADPRAVLHSPLSPLLVEMQLIAYIPILLFGLIAVPIVARRSLAALGLRAPSARAILGGFAGAIGMFAVVSIVAAIQSVFVGEHEQSVVRLFEESHNGPTLVWFIVITVAFAPFVEEFVFRGFVFNALLRRLPFVGAALVSGAIFAASHADPYALLPLTCGGAVLATVYYRTGSLLASMLTHGLFNGASLFLILFKDRLTP